MGTNGVLVTDKVVGKMIECGVQGVAISIDSVDPETHNQFRGGPDAWEYSVRFKRCTALPRPGFGSANQARSSAVSSRPATA